MNSSKRQFLLASIGALLINAFLVGVGVWLFTSQIRGRLSALRETQSALTAVDKDQASLAATKETVRNNTDALSRIKRAFLATDESALVSFIETLEKTAGTLGLTINITNASVNDSAPDAFRVEFRFTTQGSFRDTAAFLALLESGEAFTRFRDLSFDGSGDNVRLQATLLVASL